MKTAKPFDGLSRESIVARFEAMLLDDSDALKLKKIARSKPKHIFGILGRETDELTFSRLLKYFLDPSEEHGIGSELLRHLLHKIIASDEEGYRAKGISRLEIDLLPLDDAEVYREYGISEFGRLDILVQLPFEILVIIEVKLLSSEGISLAGEPQTVTYERWAKSHRAAYKRVIAVLLSPSGFEPASNLFSAFDFGGLQDAMESIGAYPNSRESLLFENFLNWIKELKPMDSDVIKLCRSIYKNYKDEIDLIVSNLPSIQAFYRDIANLVNGGHSFINGKHSGILAHAGQGWITFSPESWMNEKKLALAKKYSLPRIEYISSEESQSLLLVIPQEGLIHDRILDTAHKVFKKNKEEVMADGFKNWGNLYLRLGAKQELVPESLIDTWEEEVKLYAKRAVEETTRIEKILTPEYLLGQ